MNFYHLIGGIVYFFLWVILLPFILIALLINWAWREWEGWKLDREMDEERRKSERRRRRQ